MNFENINRMIGSLARLLLRTVFLLLGLVFLLSLLAVALLLLAFWLARALWARLTGQPVQPLVFTFLRRTQWDRFYRSADPRRADAGDVIDVAARAVEPGPGRISNDRS